MPWKLYIDSRKRIPYARGDTDSDFAIQLPYPISVTGKCFVDVILLTNTFFTIRTGENDRLFIDELAAQTKRILTLPEGQYTVYSLKDQLVFALNTNKLITGEYRVQYMVDQNVYEIDIVNPVATDQFRIWQENYLPSHIPSWTTAFPILVDNFQSANRVFGFINGTTLDGTNVIKVKSGDAPDMQPHKQLFLMSNLEGGSSESLGVNFETDIIRRIVVGNTPLNGMIHDMHAQSLDSVTINGHPELSQLWFELIDIDGKTVNLHGHPISFSIIFQNLDE
jgi:hypothetical protein